MNSNKKTARLAGILYVVVILCGVFAQVVRTSLTVLGDPGATAANVTASGELFQLVIVSDLVAHTSYLVLAIVLYSLLKTVNRTVSLAFLLLATVSVAMMCLNMLSQVMVGVVLNGGASLEAFTPEQQHAAAALLLEAHQNGYLISQVFFGGWLIPLGYVVLVSRLFPRILGYALVFAGAGYLADFVAKTLLPGSDAISIPALAVAVVGEVAFSLWLLVKGARETSLTVQSA